MTTPGETASEAAVDLDEQRTRRPALHHVNLKTTRLQELIDWYGTVLGTAPNYEFPGGAWLTNDAANHRLALIALPGLVDDPDRLIHTGMHHTAFEYETLDDLLATYVRLKAEGIEPGGCLDHGLTLSFYYHDPDGNSLELQIDNFDDWAASTEFLRTDERFQANPIGEPLDPAALVEARRAGMTPQEIHEKAYAGGFPPTGTVDLRLPGI